MTRKDEPQTENSGLARRNVLRATGGIGAATALGGSAVPALAQDGGGRKLVSYGASPRGVWHHRQRVLMQIPQERRTVPIMAIATKMKPGMGNG